MGNVLQLPTSSQASEPSRSLSPAIVREMAPVRDHLLPLAEGNKSLELPDRVDMRVAEGAVVLATVIKCYSHDLVRNTLMLALAETVDSISCTQPTSRKWIQLFVNDWIAKYPYETMEDFVLFLEGVRTSKYGPLYNGRIDGAVLFEKFGKYMAEKADFREKRIRRAQDERVIAENEAIAASTVPAEERAKLTEQIEAIAKARRIEKLEQSLKPNPKRDAHIAAGHAAAAAATTQADLVVAMTIYPYDDVQQAIQDRAVQLEVELPTRQQIIDATRELASRKR